MPWVLIDQLDSVSELTDRRSERLNVLLELLLDLRRTPNVHVIASCREFDYKHDTRLRAIDANTLHLELPPWDDIAPIVEAEGYPGNGIGELMRETLRTPWHLELFLQVAKPGELFSSLQALLEAVWQKSVTNPNGTADRVRLVEQIAQHMSNQEELFVPRTIADELPDAANALLHDDILVEEDGGRLLGFRHQTYFDYALARLFARGGQSLAEYVLDRQDGLFVRPVLLSGLETLHATSTRSYHSEVTKLLAAKPRRHIRTLLLEYICSQSKPLSDEIELILPLLSSADARLLLSALAGSPGWFERLVDSDELAAWMQAAPEQATFCVDLLSAALRFDPAGVFNLIVRYWQSDPRYDHLIHTVSHYLPTWDDSWIGLLSKVALRSTGDFLLTANNISQSQPELAARLVRAHLDRLYKEAEHVSLLAQQYSEGEAESSLFDRRDDLWAQLIEQADTAGWLPEVAKRAPQCFVERIWPWYLQVAERVYVHEPIRQEYLPDHPNSIELPSLLQAIQIAASEWAIASPHEFIEFAYVQAHSERVSVHTIIAQAFTGIATSEPVAVLEYLAGDPRRLMVGPSDNPTQLSTELIAAVAPHLSPNSLFRLESLLIDFDPYRNACIKEREPETRMAFRKWGRSYRLRLLSAFPDELLSDDTRKLKQSEARLLRELPDDSFRSWGGCVGARVTSDELKLSADADILRLFSELAQQDAQGRTFRTDLPVERSGGVLEQARALAKLAEEDPSRVVQLIGKIDPAQSYARECAGLALEGLGKSLLPLEQLIAIISNLEERGFQGADFRENVADSIQERARRGEEIPQKLLGRLETWIDLVQAPAWSERNDQPRTQEHGPAIFRGQGIMILHHGRASIVRALATAYTQAGKIRSADLIRIVRSRLGKESHPGVYAEALWYLRGSFNGELEQASSAYDAAIRECPILLEQPAAFIFLADLSGWVRPEEIYQSWLAMLAKSDSQRVRQVYGELLFLYFGRRQYSWAEKKILEVLRDVDDHVLRGLTYGARDGWFEPRCRSLATRILCKAVEQGDVDLLKSLEFAFFAPADGRFPVDNDTKQLVEGICNRPEALVQCGSQMLDALTPETGRAPALALQAAQAMLSVLEVEMQQNNYALATTTDSLTSIALTLHRNTSFRESGLQLFEDLLRLGVREAAVALEILDRRPNRRSSPTRYFPRRTPRMRRRY